MSILRSRLAAYTLPFGVFLAFLGVAQGLAFVFRSSGVWLLAEPLYWVFPLQAVVCAGVLAAFWRQYDFGPLRPWVWGVGAGLVALFLWVSPQVVFHLPDRREGFNPEMFAGSPLLYWLTVVGRFLRLMIVVPLLEEIFWRGFLMRYLIKEDFETVRFGTYAPLPFFGVAALFMLEHQTADYIPALLVGLLWNGLAVRTKSLFACVVAHMVTNFGLGLYIMATRQWGFW